MIEIVVNGRGYSGFHKIVVSSSLKKSPHSFVADFLLKDNSNFFKVNDSYSLYISGQEYQRGIITDIDITSSKKNSQIITIRGVDNTNYLTSSTVGFYNYKDLFFSDIPSPINATKYLDFFKINYSFEVDDQKLFILPLPTETYWTIILKIANHTNSVAISDGDKIRFINKSDDKISGMLINNKQSLNSNIYTANIKFMFNDAVKKCVSFNSKNISYIDNIIVNNNNDAIYFRDNLDIDNIDIFNQNKRQYLEYNANNKILCYNCVVASLEINGMVFKPNLKVAVNDNDLGVDTVLLISDVEMVFSKDKGITTILSLVDPTIIDQQIFKGSFGGDFIR